mgnify:FL=1
MKFPFFASFLIFCLWLSYEIHKHRNQEAKNRDAFWEKEAVANNTRRKSLDHLDYIKIPFDALPMDTLKEDPVILQCHKTLQELSASPIVNLTGISNTDLKLTYGAPNIDLLSCYDQRYTLLARTLQDWAAALAGKDFPLEAIAVLEFAVSTHTDVSASYKLLSSLYLKQGCPEKIRDLIPVAESLNSGMKKHILSILEEALSQAAN